MYNYSGGTPLAPTHIRHAADSPAGGAVLSSCLTSLTPANQYKKERERKKKPPKKQEYDADKRQHRLITDNRPVCRTSEETKTFLKTV